MTKTNSILWAAFLFVSVQAASATDRCNITARVFLEDIATYVDSSVAHVENRSTPMFVGQCNIFSLEYFKLLGPIVSSACKTADTLAVKALIRDRDQNLRLKPSGDVRIIVRTVVDNQVVDLERGNYSCNDYMTLSNIVVPYWYNDPGSIGGL